LLGSYVGAKARSLLTFQQCSADFFQQHNSLPITTLATPKALALLCLMLAKILAPGQATATSLHTTSTLATSKLSFTAAVAHTQHPATFSIVGSDNEGIF
jgi:hypothetical protein